MGLDRVIEAALSRVQHDVVDPDPTSRLAAFLMNAALIMARSSCVNFTSDL
jgi:hypothetical protein